MANPKIEHDELVEKLFEIFREHGYDGASLMQLAEATGLKKASLYHRFPQGKEQMVETVLGYADQWVKRNVIDALISEGDPQDKLAKALKNLRTFYGEGEKACLLRALSISSNNGHLRGRIGKSFSSLIDGFRVFALGLGKSEEEAVRLAETIVIRIQGSLVLAGALHDPPLFTRTLEDIAASFPSSPKK